jgi:hypothetical protein
MSTSLSLMVTWNDALCRGGRWRQCGWGGGEAKATRKRAAHTKGDVLTGKGGVTQRLGGRLTSKGEFSAEAAFAVTSRRSSDSGVGIGFSAFSPSAASVTFESSHGTT